jgi:hypothetical protein
MEEIPMRRNIYLLSLALLLALPVTSFAAGYAKTITVAKSGGNFNNPIKALAAITSTSADAPVLVKILPGTYDLGSATLQLKEYVDVEGAGSDKTIITSSVPNEEGKSCRTGTVMMAQNSSLNKLSVVNNGKGNKARNASGVIFNNVNARANDIKVIVGSDALSSTDNYGICSVGAAGNATLTNVAVEVRHSGSGDAGAAALVEGGSMSIAGSKLMAATRREGSTHVIDCNQSMTGTLIMNTSQLEGIVQSEKGSNFGIDVRECGATVTTTTVTLKGGDENIAVYAAQKPITITASKLFSPGNAVRNEGNVAVTISNSTVQGELPQENVRLTNTTDQNGKPLADR